MYSKEQFNWVWKDTSREGILNQFYYDHLEMEKYKNIINELEKSAKEIVRVGKNKGYQYVENLNELKTKEEIYDFIEFYYGLYLLEQLDKLKELKEGK